MLFLLVTLLAETVDDIKASVTGIELSSGIASWLAFAVFATVMFMLLAPRIWGAVIACRDPKVRAGLGGAGGVVRSILLEFGISVLIAPIMMAFHTLFIFSTLSGHRVEWDAQSRTDSGVGWRQAWRAHRGQTIAGVVTTIAVVLLATESLFWLMPILVGLLLSIPISMAVSSAPFGAWFKQKGFLRIPEETDSPAIVQRFERARGEIRALDCPPRSLLFQQLFYDPVWLRSHFAMLDLIGAASAAPPAIVEECKADIRLGRWSDMSNDIKRTLLSDPAALTELHHEVWSTSSVRLAANNRTIVQLPAGEFALTEGHGS